MGEREHEDLCTQRLRPGECLTLKAAARYRIMCCAGKILIARQDGPHDVILHAGERISLSGVVVVTALEGMKDEWLEDTGIVVMALSKVLA